MTCSLNRNFYSFLIALKIIWYMNDKTSWTGPINFRLMYLWLSKLNCWKSVDVVSNNFFLLLNVIFFLFIYLFSSFKNYLKKSCIFLLIRSFNTFFKLLKKLFNRSFAAKSLNFYKPVFFIFSKYVFTFFFHFNI